MALFMKQDFTPPILSRKWVLIKFRPNVLLHSREHIIAILESGLLFREDSVEVEQDAPAPDDVWRMAGGGKGGWMTRGERLLSVLAVGAGVLICPPKSFQRSTIAHVVLLAALPVSVRLSHRALSRGSALRVLLSRMRDYVALARRAAACLKEYTAMCKELNSLCTVLESIHALLCRQQTELAVLMSRCSSALLGNAPWLRADVAWDAVSETDKGNNLLKIHHAFLVVQSTLLKHIAMAHYVPPAQAQKKYRNHNERLYWLHTVLIEHLNGQFKENYEALDRMYRLLKNYGSKDTSFTKKPGFAINDSWLYSEVHSGIARTTLELKMALSKCTSLDMLLDSCAVNKQELDLEILNKDLDALIEGITKSLHTTQSAQLRLKKLQSKFGVEKPNNAISSEMEVPAVEENAVILKIEDKEPESKDEVFYLLKTEDDENVQPPASDTTTEPGEKEKETTQLVLNELKRKLVRREDLMRERERQALVKTMPELKDKVPEFPRQIKLGETEHKKGYISKLRNNPKKKLFKKYIFQHKRRNKMIEKKNCLLKKYCSDSHLENYPFKAKDDLKRKNDIDEDENFKFTKKDLELTPSSSESDFESDHNNRKKEKMLLREARVKRDGLSIGNDEVDESLKPMEYNFGTGMAIASVLQVNNKAKILNMCQEEVFIGDGEISNDSGNDEDV